MKSKKKHTISYMFLFQVLFTGIVQASSATLALESQEETVSSVLDSEKYSVLHSDRRGYLRGLGKSNSYSSYNNYNTGYSNYASSSYNKNQNKNYSYFNNNQNSGSSYSGSSSYTTQYNNRKSNSNGISTLGKVIIIAAIVFFGLILVMLVIPALLARRAKRFRMKTKNNTGNDYQIFQDEGKGQRRSRKSRSEERPKIRKNDALVLPGFLSSASVFNKGTRDDNNHYRRYRDIDVNDRDKDGRKPKSAKRKSRSSNRSTRTKKTMRDHGEKQRTKSRKTRVYTSE
mmetsp:Transcript_16643/g.31523  ORF Transcript_16643/g.31523 Transcript_16643/m.31523 type:complete len:286 (-) Transcript_16643:39-896(-)